MFDFAIKAYLTISWDMFLIAQLVQLQIWYQFDMFLVDFRQMHGCRDMSPRYGDGILVLLKLGWQATCSKGKEATSLGFLRCLKADVFFFLPNFFGRWVA